ncbi:MAG: hypothetical protein HWE18_15350 [Gammaproteobacteria bacterium]|nr:hypothetical protein [Gammaproteobacteria bacterium]
MYSSRWAVVLVASWLGVCALAFWWFEYRHWMAFDTSMVQFDSKAIGALYPILNPEHTVQILVVHFSDDDCPWRYVMWQ